MIVVHAPAGNEIEQLHRRQVLGLLSTVHMVYEVESVDTFRVWVDKNLEEMAAAGFGRYLQRVIFIGPLGGVVCEMLKERIAPSCSFRVLPIPETWAWLWTERDKLLEAARRVG